jgi:hypothetical protein
VGGSRQLAVGRHHLLIIYQKIHDTDQKRYFDFWGFNGYVVYILKQCLILKAMYEP